MNNLLALALTVVIVWNISMTYALYKIKAFNSNTLRALDLTTKGIKEIVSLISTVVDTVNEHTNRIVDIEAELDEKELV